MSVFEPIFILLALLFVGALGTAAVMAATGRFTRAGRVVRRVCIGTGVYMVTVAGASLVGSRTAVPIGEAQCFDDWCITVTEALRTPASNATTIDVRLTLSSRAKRTPMGETGTVAYLVDGTGRRFDPVPEGSAVPFSTVLQPGQSLVATRRFSVSNDATGVGFVYTHEGGIPIGWFIIGGTGWFRAPPVVPLGSEPTRLVPHG